MSVRLSEFVTVDLDLPTHERVMATIDPLRCLGLWLAMTCHSRKHLTDGRVLRRTAETMCGGANVKLLASMISTGLLEVDETHYTILRYAPRNQTKAMVEADRAGARARAAKSRANKADRDAQVTHSSLDESSDSAVVSRVTDVLPLSTRARAPASLSFSSCASVLEGEQGEALRDDPRAVGLDEPLSSAALERVETIAMSKGWRPVDVEAEWTKYVGKVASKRPRSELVGNWQSWLIDAKRFADRDAERNAKADREPPQPARKVVRAPVAQ